MRYKEEVLYYEGGEAEKLWTPPPWKCSKPGWMRFWATWSSGRCPCPWQEGLELDDL